MISSSTDFDFAQELRVKKYPDFMCKKDPMKSYESKKVWLGHVR